MRVRLIAAGTRLPEWINKGVADYAKRFAHGLQFELVEIALAKQARAQQSQGWKAEDESLVGPTVGKYG